MKRKNNNEFYRVSYEVDGVEKTLNFKNRLDVSAFLRAWREGLSEEEYEQSQLPSVLKISISTTTDIKVIDELYCIAEDEEFLFFSSGVKWYCDMIENTGIKKHYCNNGIIEFEEDVFI